MIDSIIIPPSVHLTIGTLVLITNGIVLVVSGWLALKKRPVNRTASATFILFQLVLMVQTLIGIKLLDQGLGILQLYIHYLGGAAPLFFCLLYYWLPPSKNPAAQNWRLLAVAALSLFFTLLTFTVGRIYVAEGTVAEGTVAEGTVAEGTVAEGTVAEGTVAEGTVAEGTAAEGQEGASMAIGHPDAGESLYVTCAGCHGAGGAGVDGLGVALAQNEYIQSHSDEALVLFIITGRKADAPDNSSGLEMPAWGGNPSLTEQNLVDIVAYLRTLEGNN